MGEARIKTSRFPLRPLYARFFALPRLVRPQTPQPHPLEPPATQLIEKTFANRCALVYIFRRFNKYVQSIFPETLFQIILPSDHRLFSPPSLASALNFS